MEGRPSCSDPALDFQCLLLVERDSLTQIFHAFVLCQYFDAHFTDFNKSFCVWIHVALVAENFRLVWVNPESHFLGCRICSLEVANSIRSSANRRSLGSLVLGRSSKFPFLSSFAIVVFRFLMSTAVPCWTASWTSDHLAWNLFGYRNFHSLRLSVLTPSDLCKISPGSWRTRDRHCKIWVPLR